MLRRDSNSFRELRTFIDSVPVIDTHEHHSGVSEPVRDVINLAAGGYYRSDYISTCGEELSADGQLEERLERFLKVYNRSDKTAYAKGARDGIKACWNLEEMTNQELSALEVKLSSRDNTFLDFLMEKHGIKMSIYNPVELGIFLSYLEKGNPFSKYTRFAFPVASIHNIHSKNDIKLVERFADRVITRFDDYLHGITKLFEKAMQFGIVCLKDNSAYRRKISYKNVPYADAECVFNEIISNPREIFGDSMVRVLDDYLFHFIIRLAARYDLPVQVHTGHMAGSKNDIEKANAVYLQPVLELHSDVVFDLFHGNWPYMDEYLFIGKNYHNAILNLCWVQTIDPLYSIELMKRIVMTVPQSKVIAFGGDSFFMEHSIGYLLQTRDNIAYALSELVDILWITLEEARQIAADWLFNNPNNIYKMGFKHFQA